MYKVTKVDGNTVSAEWIDIYKIITVSGYTLAADGAEYVVIDKNGVEVYRDYHKGRAEAKMRELINNG